MSCDSQGSGARAPFVSHDAVLGVRTPTAHGRALGGKLRSSSVGFTARCSVQMIDGHFFGDSSS
eukprot:1552010-Pyramimonas_sp.AAC.1